MKTRNGRLPVRINLTEARNAKLKAFHGVSQCPTITTAADVATAFWPVVETDQEVLISGLLDASRRLIAWQIVAVGFRGRTAARVPDLFGLVLGKEDHQILFAYNGKGAVPTRDLDFAEDLLGAAAILGIEIFDIVRITGGGHQSLKAVLGGTQEASRPKSAARACA